jgi:hypothetical protein
VRFSFGSQLLANAIGIVNNDTNPPIFPPPFNPLAPNGTFTGTLRISGDDQLLAMWPVLNLIMAITGDVYLSSMSPSSNVTHALPSLQTVGGSVTVVSSNGNITLSGVFPVLTSVGGTFTSDPTPCTAIECSPFMIWPIA